MEDTILGLLGIAICIAVYFIPWMVANANNHVNVSAIAMLNLLTGWTFIGWLIALIWALCKTRKI